MKVELGPPRAVVLAAVTVLLMATASALAAPLSAPWQRLAALVVLAGGGAALVRWAGRRPRSLRMGADGRVTLEYGTGCERARLGANPRVLPFLLTVPFVRRTRSGRTLIVTPDMTGRRDYRRLCRRLRTVLTFPATARPHAGEAVRDRRAARGASPEHKG